MKYEAPLSQLTHNNRCLVAVGHKA